LLYLKGFLVEPIQKQLTTMNAKLEAMYQKIDVLSKQVAELLNTRAVSVDSSLQSGGQSPASIVHRDVLEDEDPMIANETKGKSMSQELQMQRLMAQLTAAYNRIAALEEQLLAQRVH
jgi:uncharacterized coiled-coil protein SlyX